MDSLADGSELRNLGGVLPLSCRMASGKECLDTGGADAGSFIFNTMYPARG